MDVVHFLKSQRYRSRLPLRQLHFTVAVYRAIVVEEANVELLAEVTVPWDGKVFSPAETLRIYQDVARLTHRPTTSNGEVRAHLAGDGERAAAAAQQHPPASAAADALGLSPTARRSNTGAAATAASPHHQDGVPEVLQLPPLTDVVRQLQRPTSFFFTRPTAEDFIDAAEEDFPVDPPQGPSLLAPVILRQHRRDHQPNRKMYLMWATGAMHTTEGGHVVPVSAIDVAATAASSSAVDPFAAPAASSPLVEVDAVHWKGEERVLCTLTAEQDEYVFTARPSLDDVHTLYVDAAHIYSFRVTVSRTAAAAAGSGAEEGRQTALRGGFDPSAAPLDVVLANVRELAHNAEEEYEQMEISRDAVARRLLRQAAMMAPAERGGSALTVTAAAATAQSPLPEEGGGRPRRASLGFRVPSPTAAASAALAGGLDRSVSVAYGGALGMSLAQTRATGVGGALLSRSAAMMRSGHALPRGMCQYYMCGTVDRCVGIPEATVFLRCHVVEDGAAASWLYDPLTTSSPSAVCTFSSQLAHISAFVADASVFDVDHVFNLPFDYTFVGPAVSGSPLRLIVAAFTEGEAGEGLQSAVAYACVTLPIATPGRHSLTAAMWAPHKTGVEFLRSVLVGGAPSLVDVRQAGPPPSRRTGISVKEALYADSVGRVMVTVNIMQHRSLDDV